MEDSKRDELYDWLRLIATVFVVIGHSSYTHITATHGSIYYDLGLLSPHPAYYSWPLALCRQLSGWVYSFHMPLFFMLSGAVQALARPRRAGEFVRAKTRRLLLPYFFYGWLFMLPVKYWGGFYDKEDLWPAARGLLLGQDSGHLWFLTALFWCMAAFLLLQRAAARSSLLPMLAAAGAVSLLAPALPFDILGLHAGLQALFWFVLGYAFEKKRQTCAPWGPGKTLAAAAVLLLVQAVKMPWFPFGGPAAALIGALFTLSLAKLCTLGLKNRPRTRAWQVLIRDLFYVYIFHDPLEYLVLKLFLPAGLLSTAWGCYAYTFCRTAGVFLCSLLLGEGVYALRRLAARRHDKATAGAH